MIRFPKFRRRESRRSDIVLLSLNEIPFCDFQRFLIDRETRWLGSGPDDIIEHHAQALYDEYMDLTSTDESNAQIGFHNNLLAYEAKILLTDKYISFLEDMYDPIVAGMLREDYDYDLTEETYREDLKKIKIESQNLIILRDQAADEIADTSNSKPATYKYYADLLVAISTKLKFNVDDKISTMAFCSYLQAFMAQCKSAAQNTPVEDE